MYKKILIPTDGSKSSHEEIKRAERLIDSEGEIIILAVAKKLTPTRFESKTKIAKFNERMKLEAKKNAQDMKNKLNTPALVRCEIVVGAPADTIIQVAQDENVELIIISSSGKSGVKILIGSVAQRVIKQAECDVLMIPIKN